MESTWARTAAVLIVGTFLFAVGSVVVGGERDAPATGPGPRPSAGSTPRNVLVEVTTSGTCGPCAVADPGFVRLLEEYSDQPLVWLFWHVWWPSPGTDPFYAQNPGDIQQRVQYYGVDAAPTNVYDGGGAYSDDTLWAVGSGATPAQSYDLTKPYLDAELATTTNLAMALTGDLTSTTGTVYTTITATDPVTQSNLRFRLIVWEDGLYCTAGCTNGIEAHRGVVRDIVADDPITIAQGETLELTNTFTLNGAWDANRLGITAIVQTDNKVSYIESNWGTTNYNAEVLQTTSLRFVPPTVLLHRDDLASPYTPDYTEYFERDVAEAGHPYKIWNTVGASDDGDTDMTNEPTAADLSEYAAVIWPTGTTSTPLSSTEMTTIQSYLDSGAGNLLITGQNIGQAHGTTSFYQNVLDASFLTNMATPAWITGVSGDPASGAFYGTTMSFAGTSPDRVQPRPGASAAFNFCNSSPCSLPGLEAAAVRTTHDTDSRILYMAENYFEGSDIANREAVMDAVLAWLDGAAGPTATITGPLSGDTLAPADTVDITWSAKDVTIPTNGVDVYYAEDGASPSWVALGTGQPNDGVASWTIPNVQASNACVRVVVRDGDTTTPDADIQECGLTIGTPWTLDLSASGPKRLISLPVTLASGDPADVFSSVIGSIGTVRWYDPTDAADPWKVWSPTRGGDLLAVDNAMGMWVEVTGTATLSLFGSVPASTNIQLKAGWNLVGYPSDNAGYTVGLLKSATGATRVEGFDGTAAPYYLRALPDSYELQDGEGYWVYVPVDIPWTVIG